MIMHTALKLELDEIMMSAIRQPMIEAYTIAITQRLSKLFHRYNLDNLLFRIAITDRQLTVVPMDHLSELALLAITECV